MQLSIHRAVVPFLDASVPEPFRVITFHLTIVTIWRALTASVSSAHLRRIPPNRSVSLSRDSLWKLHHRSVRSTMWRSWALRCSSTADRDSGITVLLNPTTRFQTFGPSSFAVCIMLFICLPKFHNTLKKF